jgi:hypothetical protein
MGMTMDRFWDWWLARDERHVLAALEARQQAAREKVAAIPDDQLQSMLRLLVQESKKLCLDERGEMRNLSRGEELQADRLLDLGDAIRRRILELQTAKVLP